MLASEGLLPPVPETGVTRLSLDGGFAAVAAAALVHGSVTTGDEEGQLRPPPGRVAAAQHQLRPPRGWHRVLREGDFVRCGERWYRVRFASGGQLLGERWQAARRTPAVRDMGRWRRGCVTHCVGRRRWCSYQQRDSDCTSAVQWELPAGFRSR